MIKFKFNKIRFVNTCLVIFGLVMTAYVAYRDYFYDASDVYVSTEQEAVVHFIDAGQADCAVIVSPYGNILIDAGLYDNVRYTKDYIDSLGIDKFEYAIFTHPHSDHIGGAAKLIDAYWIENVILPDVVSTSTFFEKMLDAIDKNGINVIEGKAGENILLGEGAKLELLAPVGQYGSKGKNNDGLNNASVVAKFTYGEVSFLFTGDAEIESEEDMMYNDLPMLDSDILKVGHHGSSTSSSINFMYAVSPEIAVISAGKNNDYGHPHRETIQTLNKINAETYITYEVGNVIITTDGKTYEVETEK